MVMEIIFENATVATLNIGQFSRTFDMRTHVGSTSRHSQVSKRYRTYKPEVNAVLCKHSRQCWSQSICRLRDRRPSLSLTRRLYIRRFMDSVIHTRRWSSLTIITLILHLQKVVERIVVLDSKSCEMNIPGNDRADSADKSLRSGTIAFRSAGWKNCRIFRRVSLS